MNNVYSLQELFGGRMFRVPDYQRGFAWEDRQLDELLEDLETLPEGRDHYTGTLVLHRPESGHQVTDEAGTTYAIDEVVDGQQRLTSLTILLDRIADKLRGFEDVRALADGTVRTYVATKDANGTPLYKLTLNPDSKTYFQDAILGANPVVAGPTIASHERLLRARDRFDSYLDGKADALHDDFEAFLRDLHGRVTTRIKWTLYEVESSADVGVIFEVMNDRGKPLSELDKVKNYLMYLGSKLVDFEHHELDEEINEAWAHLFAELMRAHLSSSEFEDQLLRAHWLVAYDPQPRRWTGARSIKERLNLRAFEDDAPGLIRELSRYAKGLSQSAVAFADARNPARAGAFNSYAGSPEIRDEIARWNDRLVRLNVVAPFLPLLIATRRRFPNEGGPYLELVKLAEVFVFRVFTLMRRRADVGQAALFRIGYELNLGEIEFDEAIRRVKATLVEICSASTFESGLRDDRDWYKWGGLTYFLYEYERALALEHGVEPDVPWQEVRSRDKAQTIEHILPQSPTDPYWQERFSADDIEHLTHYLGNLTLTKDNSSYGRRAFPDKRGDSTIEGRCYANGAFYIERELAALGDWTPDTVRARGERLIQWGLARWALDESDIGDPVDDLIEDDTDGEARDASVESALA